jgi:hypothetical protein
MSPGQSPAPVVAVVPVPVPGAAQVGALLQSLAGCDVDVAPGKPVLPGREAALVAVYVTDDQEVIGAVVVCELPLAAHLGGALGRVPVDEVERSLAGRGLSPDLAENAHEVLNVVAAAFDSPGAPALRLQRVHAVGEQLPAEVARTLTYVVRRVDLQVQVVGYGGGRFSAISIG